MNEALLVAFADQVGQSQPSNPISTMMIIFSRHQNSSSTSYLLPQMTKSGVLLREKVDDKTT